VNQIFLSGWPCLVLAEFMVRWRWEIVLPRVYESNSGDGAGYVLISNICAAKWDLQANIRRQVADGCAEGPRLNLV
jgi:hypothetical protein